MFRCRGRGVGLILCHAEEVIQAVSLLLENAAERGKPPRGVVRVRCAADRARVRHRDRRRRARGSTRLPGDASSGHSATTKPGHRGLGLYFARIIVEETKAGSTSRSARGRSSGWRHGRIRGVAIPRGAVEEG